VSKEILKIFFNATGGPNWKKKDGWMNDDLDFCFWYGITCNDDYEVESIIIGMNNLVGKLPKEVFELPGLKSLGLYSNPLEIDFDGISKASNLLSLQLESTKIKTLDGIGDAPSLVDLDVRFTALTGTLSLDITKLKYLETFLVSDNDLSGSLPSFSANRKLAVLRLDANNFSGTLPSFSMHPFLRNVDVSKNRLEGPISNELLKRTDVSKSIFLDLSSNAITGIIPGSLSRFDDLTIYARDNKIESIHPDLCAKGKWNGGDVGMFGCDGILCPPQFFSLTGRMSSDNSQCLPCTTASYFGSAICDDSFGLDPDGEPESSATKAGPILASTVLCTMATVLAYFIYS